MKEKYFFKILNRFSLLFAIFNYLTFSGENILLNVFLFIWFVLLIFISYCTKNKDKKYYIIPLLVMCVPVFFIRNISDILLFIIIFAFAVLFILKDNYNLFFSSSKKEFKKGIFIISFIFIFSFICRDLPRFERVLLPYFLIFLVSTIILSRISRIHNSSKQINIINIFYTVIFSFIIFTLCVKNVKNFIFLGIKNIFLGLGKIIYSLIYLVLKLLPNNMMPNLDDSEYEYKYDPLGSLGNGNQTIPTNQHITIYILGVIALILLIFIITILIKHLFVNRKSGKLIQEEYTEYNEFILNKTLKNYKDNLLNKLKNTFSSKNNKEKIRYYYHNYMKECIKKDISLEKSDTSYEINLKSRKTFNDNIINNLRKIYVKIRYSNCNVDDATVTEFIEHYKKLKK